MVILTLSKSYPGISLMAGEEEDDGDDGDKKTKPQNELFQVGSTEFLIGLSKA